MSNATRTAIIEEVKWSVEDMCRKNVGRLALDYSEVVTQQEMAEKHFGRARYWLGMTDDRVMAWPECPQEGGEV